MDGFVPRRPGGQSSSAKEIAAHELAQPTQRAVIGGHRREVGQVPLTNDLDESLKNIDVQEPEEKGKKGRRRGRGAPKSKLRRIIKWSIIGLVIILVAIAAWFVYKTLNTGSQIFTGNILDIVQNKPLKEDENGRSNILILGTSLDDPGHEAGYLTDSIMVMSIDQKNKNAYLMSIPRDLEVKYGQSCLVGDRGKINVYFNCVGGGKGDVEADRAALTKSAKLVGGILGLDIQYGVNVNYTVMRELVSAVGGITVNIEGSGGAPGVMDSNFDWKCGLGDPKVSAAERKRRCPPNGHFIDYPNGPANLDAEHALYLAQARGDVQPTYGLGRSNFDREINQQKIVKAIREKAMSAGVLADFGKVNGILDALGNNLRTTFEASEIRTLVSLAKDIKDEDLQSISFVDADPPLMTGNAQPSAGMYQFGQIQAYVKKKLTSNPVTREEAKVVVMNGSGVAGVAQKEADKLTAQGFIISSVESAPAGSYGDVDIYQIGDGKTATKDKLQSIYGVDVKTTAPPVKVTAGTNFVIIVGKDRSTTAQ